MDGTQNPDAHVERKPFAVTREREALRIQAAAVAAQQAALTEQEIHLERQRLALQQQENQLAAYLEEQRRDVDAQQQQLQESKQAAAADRATLRAEREAIAREKSLAAVERARLAKLWDRFKKSWVRKWRDKEADMARQVEELAAARRHLDKERSVLEDDQRRFHKQRLRHNGEIELTRRQLQHGWGELGAAQRQWEEGQQREATEREKQQATVQARAADLLAAEKALGRDREHWNQTRALLVREQECLEARVRHLRAEMVKLGGDRANIRAAAPREAVTSYPPGEALARKPAHGAPAPALLARLAGDLADQRRRLLEHWENLLRQHRAWKVERQELLLDLETASQALQQRACELEGRQLAMLADETALRQAQQYAAEQRARLDAWQAGLVLREASWEAERPRLLADAARREELAEAMRQELEQMRDQWTESRHAELERLRAARVRYASLRKHYSSLWRTCQRQKAVLADERRLLTTKVLALERWRQELLPRTENTPAAEKRLDRLTQRELDLRAEAEAELARKEKEVRLDRVRLEQWVQAVIQNEANLAAREDELTRRLTEFELRQAALADGDRRREEELEHLRRWQARDGQHILALREEVERIAQTLLDGAVPSSVPSASQAA